MRVCGGRLKALPSPADDSGDEDEIARHAEQNQTNDVAFPTDREDGEDEPDMHWTTKRCAWRRRPPD